MTPTQEATLNAIAASLGLVVDLLRVGFGMVLAVQLWRIVTTTKGSENPW